MSPKIAAIADAGLSPDTSFLLHEGHPLHGPRPLPFRPDPINE